MHGGPPRRLLEELTPLVDPPTKNNPLDLRLTCWVEREAIRSRA